MIRRLSICFILAGSLSLLAMQQRQSSRQAEWLYYGGDPGGTKYSPLDDINVGNVQRLEVAWQWKHWETPLTEYDTRPGYFEATPLMIDGVLYVTTPYNSLAALDAESGKELWRFDGEAYKQGQVLSASGWKLRGTAFRRDRGKLVIFLNSRNRLFSLDASTHEPMNTFGKNGEVSLTDLPRISEPKHATQSSPPVVYKDLVIVGSQVPDRVQLPDPVGYVQAFNARTGKRVWTFSVIPQSSKDPGAETWENESWRTSGHGNVWAPMALDEARGLLYLPTSTPSSDYYGGQRPGANLFAESLVCLDAATGRLKWYFQTVHHGLWDYDLPAPPVLATVQFNGRPRDVVAVPTKTGFLFVFDRASGETIWPIEERSVPPSDVPGEVAAQSQPFPSKPKPFAKQGFSYDDLIDFTPAIKARALELTKNLRFGPLFTPPSLGGTITMPGAIGGAGWGGGAFDPTTGTIYIKATNQPAMYRIIQPTRTDSLDTPYAADLSAQGLRVTMQSGDSTQRLTPLPINKPPYGTLVAIDLNSGDTKWNVTLGDTPAIRNHPLLRGLNLPPVGVAGSPGPIATAGGLLFVTGGGSVLYAIDSRDGSVAWSADLEQTAYSTPMTYRTRGGKQFVVVATGAANGAKLVAFALP